MSDLYANDFTEISDVLSENTELRAAVLSLIDDQPIPAKVMEGGDRLEKFRAIMKSLVQGEIDLTEAYRRTEIDLSRQVSVYSGNNRVFCKNWAERHVRTQFSRFYNQAVMEKLLADGHTQCFVPHSSAERPDSPCSLKLAGGIHDLKTLYDWLVRSYVEGKWIQEVKIPDHPHCTHVVVPVSSVGQ